MAFKGFEIVYPEYQVVTPQTRLSFKVRCLNVQEEERLKGSFTTPIKIIEHLNKCLYDAIVEKPEHIKEYNDFLRSITIKDRDALLYGLYHTTYEEIRDYNVKCSSCSKEYQIRVLASSTFNINMFPQKENVLKKEVKIPLEILKGVEVFLKQATLYDEFITIQNLSARPNSSLDIINQIINIKSIVQTVEGKEPIAYTDKEDIMDAYLTLPSKDKRLITSKYESSFGQYGVELKMNSYCSSCGANEIIKLDLVEQFFRMVFQLR